MRPVLPAGRRLPRLALWCAIVSGLLPPAAVADAPVDFRRDVLPILSDACFRCHGPDEGTREGKNLRLDLQGGLYRTRNEITIVKPGAPDDSEIVIRTGSTDPDEIMPPPEAQRQLKPAEIAMLRRK